MVKRIHYMSYQKAAQFKPDTKALMIRIGNDPDDKPQTFPLKHPELFVEYKTHFGEGINPDVRPVPKGFSQEDLENYQGRRFSRLIAGQIYDVVKEHESLDEVVVHCFGGVTRSPAVASVLAQAYKIPLFGFDGELVKSLNDKNILTIDTETIARIMRDVGRRRGFRL